MTRVASLPKVKMSQVTVERMASKLFEGWKIFFEGNRCGRVKFIPHQNDEFQSHVTVDIHIPKPERGRHIGRCALKKALKASDHSLFIAHLRKSNVPSKRALQAAGFQETEYSGKQLCLIYRK